VFTVLARRKSVMLDEEHAGLLQELASRYGVSVAGYLRGLVRAAWEAEERGVNAVAALRRGVLFEHLMRLNVIPVPLELLANLNPLEARKAGRRLGVGLAAVANNVLGEYLAGLAERLGIGIAEYRRLLILPQYDDAKKVAAQIIVGIAEGGGLHVEENNDIIVIKWKQEGS
jgi:hypothetical protein